MTVVVQGFLGPLAVTQGYGAPAPPLVSQVEPTLVRPLPEDGPPGPAPFGDVDPTKVIILD